MIEVTQTEMKEVLVLLYEKRMDSRGFSYSNFSQREHNHIGVNIAFVEETVYCPHKAGTLYGIHFQNNPMAQSKLLYVTSGRGLDFAVDLRKKSPTYKKWVSVELSAENRKQIFIPKGFGHAFLSLEDNTKVVMRIDRYFDPKYKRGIAWNDPELHVSFPIENPILAQHDKIAPLLKNSDCNL